MITDYCLHIVLATNRQLSLFRSAKHWFVDGTFKIVKQPFIQMWSIHIFVRYGENVKQVPVLFVIMSSRQKVDYISLLRWLKEHYSLSVETITSDFEIALWRAVSVVFPDVIMQGCLFESIGTRPYSTADFRQPMRRRGRSTSSFVC